MKPTVSIIARNEAQKSTKRFRWECPHSRMQFKLGRTDDVQELRDIAVLLVNLLDHDQVQDLFEQEMTNDGYFNIQAPNPDCVTCNGKGWFFDSTGVHGFRHPCLCSPKHGANVVKVVGVSSRACVVCGGKGWILDSIRGKQPCGCLAYSLPHAG